MEISSIRNKALPLLVPALCWLAGLVLAQTDVIPLSVTLVVLSLSALALLKWRSPPYWMFFLGMAIGMLHLIYDVDRMSVSPDWLDQKLSITARVERVQDYSQYLKLNLSEITRKDGQRLYAYADLYLYRSKQQIHEGDRITAEVKFHLPRNKRNPDHFDYVAYTFSNQISVIGSALGDVALLEHAPSLIQKLRYRVMQSVSVATDGSRGILSALLLADRTQIPLQVTEAFAASGASHLLAISGLHVGMVAAWGYMLMWWLLTRREAWIVKFSVKGGSIVAGLCLAFFYAMLAGWPIPAQRALLMLGAAVLAWNIRAHQLPLNTMLAALILITLLDPLAVMSPSLWLSFVATSALLIWFYRTSQSEADGNIITRWAAGRWVAVLFKVSVIASLATLPLIAFLFERFPTWSVLVNLLLVPLYSLYVLPLALIGEWSALLGVQSVAQVMMKLSAFGIDSGNLLLERIQNWPAGNLWLRGDLSWMHLLLAFLLAGGGLLWLRSFRKTAVFAVAASLLIYVKVMTHSGYPATGFYVWDVGQGASSLLVTDGEAIAFDAPGKDGARFNGGSIAADNIRVLGLVELQAVVLSHAQSDHGGGLNRLMASLNGVKEFWLADVPGNHRYLESLTIPEQTVLRWLKQGDSFMNGESKIEVLWPPRSHQPSNGNNASLVLRVTSPEGRVILLPGDMERPVEHAISSQLGPVDLLLVPHHGSNTSSTPAFVEATRPAVAISQSGYQNHYHFPKSEVVSRYLAVGSRFYDSAESAIYVAMDNENPEVSLLFQEKYSKRKAFSGWLNDAGKAE